MTANIDDRKQVPVPPTANPSIERSAAYYRLKADLEDLYHHEADLLDDRRFRDWLELLAEDIIYFMPIRRNVKFGQHAARKGRDDVPPATLALVVALRAC
jgi:hypothetical protein